MRVELGVIMAHYNTSTTNPQNVLVQQNIFQHFRNFWDTVRFVALRFPENLSGIANYPEFLF
jgi:hypothetical protein